MKRFFVAILFIITLYSHALAYEPENIITDLIINESDYKEIELVLTEEGMYLPAKYFLDLFDIKFEMNHLEKSISGKSLAGKSFYINKTKATFDSGKSAGMVFYIKEGLLADTKDEFFISAELLASITQSEILPNIDDVIVNLNSEKFITVVEEKKNYSLSIDNTPKAYEDIKFPENKGMITLDTVELQNNVTSDSTSQAYRDKTTNNFMFNNNARMVLKGKLRSGDYKVDMSTNSYRDEIFSFNGLGVQYKNKFDKYQYAVGKIDPWRFNTCSVAGDVIGYSLSDEKDCVKNYRDIEGFVGKKSVVKVTINDDFEKTLSTYGGYYSLKDIFYGKKGKRVEKVKIEEVMPDKTTKVVFEQSFSADPDRIANGQVQNDFIVGYSGLQNRLWSQNGYIYESNTKKFVTGGRYKMGLSDKLSFDNFFITDKIVSLPKNYTWGETLLRNRNYLNFFSVKNPNMLEGQTYMGMLDYQVNDKIKTKLMGGVSNSFAEDRETIDGRGLALDWESEYKLANKNSVRSNLYYYSPDFYLAGSSGSSSGQYDRLGATIRGNTQFKKLFLDGKYSLYNTNLNDFYDGGAIHFNEYEFAARLPLKKLPSLRFRYRSKEGSNKMGEITSGSFEASARKSLNKNVVVEAGIRENNYSNFYASDDFSGYNSKYSNVYANMDLRLPKQFGNVNLSHEIVETKSDNNTDSYNIAKVGYTFPLFKKFNLNLTTGYHYTGLNKGFDFGAGLMYRMQSGSTVSLNYRFNRAPGYIVENMFLPSTMRHYVTLDFSEVYGVSGGQLHSIGMNNFNKGYVEAITFLDVNQNGIKDKGEILIEGVPIKMSTINANFVTNEKGSTGLRALAEGVHNIKIFEDELPVFLSVHNKTKQKKVIKISPKERTKVYFGLISSIGTISGKVNLKDEFGKKINRELIVVVKRLDGEEVGYTTVLDDGSYSMGGIAPGEYKVMVDEDYQRFHKIHPDKETFAKVVKIPPEYKKFVDVTGVDLNYNYSFVPTI